MNFPIAGRRTRRAGLRLALALALLGAGMHASAADASKNLAPGFSALPRDATILVAPPDVELFEIGAGGVPAPRADWTTSARQSIRGEIEKRRTQFGALTVELDEATADEFGELLSLHAAVARSIALHHFGTMPLPTKDGKLDWTFADALQPLQQKSGAGYGLFIWVRDGYTSAGRTATIAITAILTLGHVIPGGGMQSAYASLVDLQSGRVLWFNSVARRSGDLRTPESATETVDELLKNFPVAPR